MIHVNDFAKLCLEQNFVENGIYVDFTMGNGHDTLWLAKKADKGIVVAFDIQKQAIDSTKTLLEKNNIKNVTLILDSHSEFDRYVNQEINGGIFNLGYLPNSNKEIVTNKDSTKEAINKAVDKLKVKGCLVIVIYVGHGGGQDEARVVEDVAMQLDAKRYQVCRYQPINKTSPPYVICIERAR